MIFLQLLCPWRLPCSRPAAAAISLTTCLILLTTTVVHGAPATSRTSEQAATSDSTPRAMTVPSNAPVPAWSGRVMAWQVLGAASGVFGGVLLGGLLGFAGEAIESRRHPDDIMPRSNGLVILSLIAGGALGLGFGTWAAGELAGSDGSLGWSMVGGLAGTLSGVVVADTLLKKGEASIVGIVLGITGSVVGYHLSARSNAPSPVSAVIRVDPSGSVLLGVPLVSPTTGSFRRDHGWRLGLISGRF